MDQHDARNDDDTLMRAYDARQPVLVRCVGWCQGFARGRVARSLLGLTLFVGVASVFSSDRAPQSHVATASALALGERVRPAAPRPSADPIAGAFAVFEMGTADAPRLRGTSSFDDSFAMVAAASRGQEAVFSGALPLQYAAVDTSAAQEMLEVVARIAPGDLRGAVPRQKPAAGGPRVEVASIAPDSGMTPVLRKPSLDLSKLDGVPKKYPAGSQPYLDLIAREAKANDVPLWVALGVIWVESKFNPKLRGSHGVMGMMQVMPSTARYLGFKGSAEDLLDAETNVVWGMKELGKGYKMTKGDLCMTIAKYTGGFMTNRVRPAAQRYCDEVRRVTGMNGT